MTPSANDAETIHQQALTAANLAFERAHEREMARKTPNGQDTLSKTNDNGPRLGRRQSIRFTGPTAVPSRNRSITRREAPGYGTSYRPSENQLQSQPQKVESSILSNKNTSTALTQPIGEFGECDNASVPSSYRRLRKAKSMFSPAKAPSAVFSDGLSYRRHFHRQSLQSSNDYHEPLRVPDPRLRKSYSFLRGVTDRISTSSGQYVANDAAIQLARDQYLRQLEQQRLKEQPSFLGLGNHRKSQKAFRRTVRTGSTNSYGSAIASPLASVETPKIKDLGHKAKNLSQTIKKKFKRAFKRSPDTEDTFPVQQIRATHPHYGDYISTSDGKEQRYPPVPEPDAELLLRVGSRESVNYTAPTFIDKSGRPGSIRSGHSDDNETNGKSRVTSWTDSTAANTINMAQTLERKRLSIIKEDGGPHEPSSSARQYERKGDGYSSFRQPVRQSSAGRVSGPLDTQRIFSALQKRLNETNREAAPDDSESGTDSSSGHRKVRPSTRTPRRTSSIRRGARDNSNVFSRSRGANLSSSLVFGSSAMESFNDEFHQQESQSTDRECHQQDHSVLRKGLTPQQIAEINEHGIPRRKRPLRDVKSAFFPPFMRVERSNPSPYRRAMHASNETEADFEGCEDRPRSEGPSSAVTGRLRKASVTGSDSIYSRSSDGETPKATRSSMSLVSSEGSAEAGTAIIMTGQSAKNEQSSHPVVAQHGCSSVASSGNWRDFMATQVASLENHGARQEQIFDAHPVKDSGHRRESAQVDSEDVSIGRSQSPSGILNQPLAIIQGNAKPWKVSKHKVAHLMSERSPLMSIGPSNNTANVKANDHVPVSRPLEHLPKVSSMENERPSLGRVHESHGGLRQTTSHSSLKIQTEQRYSPTTTNVRYSPERAERLRRLKSSSGTSLGKSLSQNENQVSRRTPSGQENYGLDTTETSPNIPQSQAGNNHKLVDSFLKGRRSVMRISEESGTDAAFL